MTSHTYEGKIKGGNILIAVHTDSAEERSKAETVFKNMGTKSVQSTTEASVPGGHSR